MPQVSGTLRVGEAKATVGALMARQRGSIASYYAVLFGMVLCGVALGLVMSAVLADGYEPHYGVGGAMGAIGGAMVYQLIQRPLAMARFKKTFQSRQQTLDLPLRMEIAADHLIYEVGGITQFVKWDVVAEVFRSHDYWIVLAQADAMFAPMRFFASTDDERKFVADLLAHVSSDARARSTEAERFIASAS